MRILILGTGAREHAIAWKLKQSADCEKIFVHPGNPGIRKSGFEALGDGIVDAQVITKKARALNIELIVIGPELLLSQGFGETLRGNGFLVFGPNSKSARLESSKIFAKEFMKSASIPTAAFSVVNSEAEFLENIPSHFPIVLKLDTLAAGKGVVIAENKEEMIEFANRVWKKNEFGKGPHQVLIETFIEGNELSYIGLCDGKTFTALSTSTDYKRVFDSNQGPNTGGMGAVSPSPYEDSELLEKINRKIIKPLLAEFKKEEIDYKGALYVGIMISKGDPFVLEFNARFGDPETQALIIRMESDLLPYLLATAKGELSEQEVIKWKKDSSVYVVLAAHGYPGKVRTGDFISGLETLEKDTPLFFSGVEEAGTHFITQGGRVLGVGALGNKLSTARDKIYAAISKIHWNGLHYRKDIGVF